MPQNISPTNGLSGIIINNESYLTGVFLDGKETGNQTPPPTLNFNAIGQNFAALSPLIDQVFFIGDGLTGNGIGTQQQFVIPDSATSLVLGIVDAVGFTGQPSGYLGNLGSFTATYSISGSKIVDVTVTANGETSPTSAADKFTYGAGGAAGAAKAADSTRSRYKIFGGTLRSLAHSTAYSNQLVPHAKRNAAAQCE